LQHRRPARHGFRHALHQRRLLRTGQQPLTRPPRPAIDPRAHIREHLRHVLHLVEDRGRRHGVEESLRIGPQPRYHVGVFEQKVARLGKQPAQQQRLAGAARPRQHHGRKAFRRPQHLLLQ
jgi:hypothetical protein